MELTDLDKLNSTLKFETPELRIQGGVELFSTKPQSYDRKLYRTLDKHINSLQQDALLQYTNAIASSNNNHNNNISKSLSPPQPSNFTTISPPSSHTESSILSYEEEPQAASLPETSPGKLVIPPGLASSLNSSPFGPLDQAASRKAFGYLISVLNSSHPDHDFSSLQPSDFRRETSITGVLNSFNNLIFSVGMPLSPTLWKSLDEHIGLKECAVYSHTPPDSFLDDMEAETLWCYMWFFFNKRRKRVAYLHLEATRTHDISLSARRERTRRKQNSSSSTFYSDYYDEEEYDLANSGDDDAVVGDLELE